MSRKTKKVKRAIEIAFDDGTTKELVITKAAALHLSDGLGRIYLEQMNDGTWRLVYDGDLIPNFTKVKSFNVIRED